MKGIVFTEFLDMLDSRFGPDTTEEVIESVAPPSGCAYTAVGTYDHKELFDLVGALSRKTGIATDQLVRAYGHWLFGRFFTIYPDLFSGIGDSFSFLESVDSTIHIEVRKLYADAELPRFLCHRNGPDSMIMEYRSHRPLADLAHGLIEGCAEHFSETLAIEREDGRDGNDHTCRFTLLRSHRP